MSWTRSRGSPFNHFSCSAKTFWPFMPCKSWAFIFPVGADSEAEAVQRASPCETIIQLLSDTLNVPALADSSTATFSSLSLGQWQAVSARKLCIEIPDLM